MYSSELKLDDDTFKSVQEASLRMQATQNGDEALAQKAVKVDMEEKLPDS